MPPAPPPPEAEPPPEPPEPPPPPEVTEEPPPPEPAVVDTRAQATTPSALAPKPEDKRPEEDAPVEHEDGWRDGHALGIEGTFAVGARIGSFNEGFGNEEHVDTSLSLGVWLALSSEWAFGLEYEHAGLGRATSTSGQNSLSIEYDVDYLWLGARVFPYRTDSLDLFLNLRAGLGWQSLDATGTRDQLPTTAAPQPFACSVHDGPGFGLAAGFGVAYRASSKLLMLGRVDGVGRRQSSEFLDGCATGAGDVTGVNAGVGLMYVFDLGKDASLAGAGVRQRQTW